MKELKIVNLNSIPTDMAASAVRVRRLITRKREGSEKLMVGVCFMDPGEQTIKWSSLETDSLALKNVKDGEAHYGPMEEIYYVIRGEKMFLKCDGRDHPLKKGDAVYLPPGHEYQLRNEGSQPSMFVYVINPALE